MGKATGFMERERNENPWRSEAERIRDYSSLHLELNPRERQEQASRCMNCGVPFCQSDYGCPLHNLIPEWNDLLWRGDERGALERLLKTAPFPEFTGRVCPALCEKACNLAEKGASVNRDNELYLIEKGYEKGWVRPRIPAARTGKRVAVAGSGPSGLAAADRLNQMGHSVTVFERAEYPGGLLMFGIPNMKLPKSVVSRRIGLMREEGIVFQTGTEATPEILKDFDAAVLCGGARKPRTLNVPGENAEGVRFAVDYLTEATRSVIGGDIPSVSARGLDVIVVGGGDTGNDCVGTAIRQGCRSLTELEMLPAPPTERAAGNPWPEWPRILRTDYGQEEAITVFGRDPRIYETTVKEILTDAEGKIEAVQTVRVRRTPEGRMEHVPGSEETLPCQLLLIAAGFTGCDQKTAESFRLTLGSRGVPETENGSHRIGGKLFTAGDMKTGQSLVVRAIADGRAAADEAGFFLK